MALLKEVPEGADLVEITEIINASSFWVTASESTSETKSEIWSKPRAQLEMLEMFLASAKLTAIPKNRAPHLQEIVAVNHPLTGKWHRGCVRAIKDPNMNLYCVFLIDHGHTVEVSASALRDIDEYYKKQEALAYRILLFGIVPGKRAFRHPHGDRLVDAVEWTPEANAFVKNQITKSSMGYFCQKGKHSNANILFGDLYLVADEGFLDLGLLLCLQKYAISNVHLFLGKFASDLKAITENNSNAFISSTTTPVVPTKTSQSSHQYPAVMLSDEPLQPDKHKQKVDQSEHVMKSSVSMQGSMRAELNRTGRYSKEVSNVNESFQESVQFSQMNFETKSSLNFQISDEHPVVNSEPVHENRTSKDQNRNKRLSFSLLKNFETQYQKKKEHDPHIQDTFSDPLKWTDGDKNATCNSLSSEFLTKKSESSEMNVCGTQIRTSGRSVKFLGRDERTKPDLTNFTKELRPKKNEQLIGDEGNAQRLQGQTRKLDGHPQRSVTWNTSALDIPCSVSDKFTNRGTRKPVTPQSMNLNRVQSANIDARWDTSEGLQEGDSRVCEEDSAVATRKSFVKFTKRGARKSLSPQKSELNRIESSNTDARQDISEGLWKRDNRKSEGGSTVAPQKGSGKFMSRGARKSGSAQRMDLNRSESTDTDARQCISEGVWKRENRVSEVSNTSSEEGSIFDKFRNTDVKKSVPPIKKFGHRMDQNRIESANTEARPNTFEGRGKGESRVCVEDSTVASRKGFVKFKSRGARECVEQKVELNRFESTGTDASWDTSEGFRTRENRVSEADEIVEPHKVSVKFTNRRAKKSVSPKRMDPDRIESADTDARQNKSDELWERDNRISEVGNIDVTHTGSIKFTSRGGRKSVSPVKNFGQRLEMNRRVIGDSDHGNTRDSAKKSTNDEASINESQLETREELVSTSQPLRSDILQKRRISGPGINNLFDDADTFGNNSCQIVHQKPFKNQKNRSNCDSHDGAVSSSRKGKKSNVIQTFFPAGFNMAEADKVVSEKIVPKGNVKSLSASIGKSTDSFSGENAESSSTFKSESRLVAVTGRDTSNKRKCKVFEDQTSQTSSEDNCTIEERPMRFERKVPSIVKEEVHKNVFDKEGTEPLCPSPSEMPCIDQMTLKQPDVQARAPLCNSFQACKSGETLIKRCLNEEHSSIHEIKTETGLSDNNINLLKTDSRNQFSKLSVKEEVSEEKKQMKTLYDTAETTGNIYNKDLSPHTSDGKGILPLSPEQQLFTAVKQYISVTGISDINQSDCITLLDQLLAKLKNSSKNESTENLEVKASHLRNTNATNTTVQHLEPEVLDTMPRATTEVTGIDNFVATTADFSNLSTEPTDTASRNPNDLAPSSSNKQPLHIIDELAKRTPVELTKHSPVTPAKCDPLEPAKRVPAEPVKCTSVEPVKSTTAEPIKCASVELGKCASIELANCDSVKPEKCAPVEPANPAFGLLANFALEPGLAALDKSVKGTLDEPGKAASEELSGSTASEDVEKTASVEVGKAVSEEPGKAVSEEPGNAASEELGHAASEELGHAASEELGHSASEEPGNAASEEPGPGACGEPGQAASEEPTHAASEDLTHAASEEPAQAASEEPTQAASEEPAQDASEEPNQDASEAPNQDASEAPGQGASEAPGQGASEERGQGASEERDQAASGERGQAASDEPGKVASEELGKSTAVEQDDPASVEPSKLASVESPKVASVELAKCESPVSTKSTSIKHSKPWQDETVIFAFDPSKTGSSESVVAAPFELAKTIPAEVPQLARTELDQPQFENLAEPAELAKPALVHPPILSLEKQTGSTPCKLESPMSLIKSDLVNSLKSSLEPTELQDQFAIVEPRGSVKCSEAKNLMKSTFPINEQITSPTTAENADLKVTSPQYRIMSVEPDPCPSFVRSPGRKIMEQLQLMVVLLHGAPKDFRHLNIVTDAILRRDVHEVLKTIMSRLMRIQMYAWPLIQQGHSCVIVGPPMSGKTLGYAVPLLDQVMQKVQTNEVQKGNGPVMLVLCSGSRSCNEIFEICYQFIKKCVKEIKMLVAYGGGAEKIEFSLINGCHILISTPRCFKRLLQLGSVVVNFARLKYFVLDEADVLTLRFLPEVDFICKRMERDMKPQERVKLQAVAVAEKWCPGLEVIVKGLSSPVVCIGAFLEAIVYAHLKPQVHFVTQSNRISVVQEVIKQTAKDFRTLVICREIEEVIAVYEALQPLAVDPQHLMMAHHDLDTIDIHEIFVKWSWMMHPVLVCSDVILQELSFQGATQLIHFSLKDVSKREFAYRCSTLIDQLPSMFDSEEEEASKMQPQMHIFISDSDSEPLPTLVRFLKRLGVTVDPDLQKRANIAEVQKDLRKDYVPLCYNTKAFGDCWNKSNCIFRHVISSADKPRNIPTYGNVKVKILHVHDVCNYSARVYEHANDSGQMEMVPNLVTSLTKKLHSYFKDDSHRVLKEKPKTYDICAAEKVRGVYHRVEILAIVKTDRHENPTELLVRFIDDGCRDLIKAERLFELPPELTEIPPQSVEIFLCRLVPCDLDWSWGPVTSEKVAKILSEALQKDRFLIGKIKLSLGHTLWLDPLECYERLATLKTSTIIFSVRRKLLEAQLAVESPQHLELLTQACARAGIDVPQYVPSNTSLHPEKSEKVDVCWAHLPADEFSLVYFIVGDHPGRFYVRQEKFEDLVHQMDKKLTKLAKERGSNSRTLFAGDYCIGRFPADNRWYRAHVENSQNDTLDLFFVDHGDRATVSRSEAVPLPKDLISQLPFQAVECCFAGVSPDQGDRWSEKSIDALYGITAKPGTVDGVKLLYAKVLNKVKPADCTGGFKYHVALVEVTPHGQALLNNTLVAWGLASQNDEQKLLLQGLDLSHLTPPMDRLVSEESEDDEMEEEKEEKMLKSLDGSEVIFEDNWDCEQLENNIQCGEHNSSALSQSLERTASTTEARLEDTFASFDFSAITEDEIMEFFEKSMEDYNSSCRAPTSDVSSSMVVEEREELKEDGLSRIHVTLDEPEKERNNSTNNKEETPIRTSSQKCDSSSSSCVENSECDTSSDSHGCIMPHLVRITRTPLVYWRQDAYFVWLIVDLPGVENYFLKWDEDHVHFWTVLKENVYSFDLHLFGPIIPNSLTHSGGLFVRIKMQKVLIGVDWPRLIVSPEKLLWLKRHYDAENSSDIDELRLAEQLRIIKEMEKKKEDRIEKGGLLPADEAIYEADDSDSESSSSDLFLGDEQYDPYDPLN